MVHIRGSFQKAAILGCFFLFFPISFLSAQNIELGPMAAQYSRPDVVFFPDGQSFAIADLCIQ